MAELPYSVTYSGSGRQFGSANISVDNSANNRASSVGSSNKLVNSQPQRTEIERVIREADLEKWRLLEYVKICKTPMDDRWILVAKLEEEYTNKKSGS